MSVTTNMATALNCVLIGLMAAVTLPVRTGGNLLFGPNADLAITAEKLNTCPQYPNLKNTIANLSVWTPPKENTLFLSGTMIIDVPLEDTPDYKYELKLLRCVRQDWSRCEKYLVMELEHMCRHLPEQGQLWSQFVGKMEEFDPHCPIKPGTYNFEDAPLDTTELKKFDAAAGYWQIEMRALYKKKVIFCIIGNALITLKAKKTG